MTLLHVTRVRSDFRRPLCWKLGTRLGHRHPRWAAPIGEWSRDHMMATQEAGADGARGRVGGGCGSSATWRKAEP